MPDTRFLYQKFDLNILSNDVKYFNLKANNIFALYTVIALILCTSTVVLMAQSVSVRVYVGDDSGPLPYTDVILPEFNKLYHTDENGFTLFIADAHRKLRIRISHLGYNTIDTLIQTGISEINLGFKLHLNKKLLEEVVVTGTMREVTKDKSALSVDIITPRIFRKTGTPNLFDATAMVNGVRPQNTCNVCNTGEIQINSLGGPYTLVMIDGMPIVSGLSSVYGLMGIPLGMIQRLEITKGPAASLYGSEAMGGVINVITKDACDEEHGLYLDYYGTTWSEHNLDMSTKFTLSDKIHWLTGLNLFWYNNPVDNNGDGFTDAALMKRFSLFNKLDIQRRSRKDFSLAFRGVLEDRWGGQTGWNRSFRGGDSLYAESIQTRRLEFISKYQWNTPTRIFTQLSYNIHHQDSYYGLFPYNALQHTGFIQNYADFHFGSRHDVLAGINYKYSWFDDDTPATFNFPEGLNQPQVLHTTGIFFQDEYRIDEDEKHTLLTGIRVDYNNLYKWIPSPRLAYKWSPDWRHILRINVGTGFRIVNVFTEDHLALSGAREVVFKEEINPEKSVNATINYQHKLNTRHWGIFSIEASAFYYHFSNRIIPDYDSDPNLILYQNLEGIAYNRGGSLTFQSDNAYPLRFTAGITYTDVQYEEEDESGKLEFKRQLFAPRWSGIYQLSYEWERQKLKIDFTGNVTGPMRLPVQPMDFRPEFSSWFTVANLQVTQSIGKSWEIYLGCKNLFNFLPQNPIMRPFDPFDKFVDDPVTNPNRYSFDPSYAYASMQGRRFYLGFRRNI